MRFTTVLLALAAAGPVFSAAVPSTQDVSSEKVFMVFFLMGLYFQASLAKPDGSHDTEMTSIGVSDDSDLFCDPEDPDCPVKVL